MMAHIINKGEEGDEEETGICQMMEFVKKSPGIDECGAIFSFEGIVRGKEPGKNTWKMELTTPHRETSERELEEIIKDVKDKFEVVEIAVVHYLGEFKVGDPLFLVVVAGPHRGETRKALNEIIERVKYELDFKKKEHTEGGTNIIMSGG